MDLAALYMDVVPKAMREFRKDMRQSRSSQLSIPQFRILAQLRFEPANNRSLAEVQGVSVAAMSRMVDWLCRNGYVERLESERDRRHVQVQLTGEGRARFESFREEARGRLLRRLESLKPQDQIELKKGLSALAKAVEHIGKDNGSGGEG